MDVILVLYPGHPVACRLLPHLVRIDRHSTWPGCVGYGKAIRFNAFESEQKR